VIICILVVDSIQRCSHPQADDGDEVMEGCLLRTCKSGAWRSSLVSIKCCYEKKPYMINTTISSTKSEDGCVMAAIDCVEETPGIAKMVLSVKNYCEEYATKEQLEEIKDLLLQQGEVGCQEDNKEESKALLIGPATTSNGKSEVLSLPDLTPLDCNIPVFPESSSHGVGSYTSDGVHICGSGRPASCNLLTATGYKDMPAMMNKRAYAASILTKQGWWVTGGYGGNQFPYQYLATTELWSNNQWQEHVSLPVAMVGHCMTSVNQSHIIITGGEIAGIIENDPVYLYSSYLYSEETGFTRIQDMKRPRGSHGCSVINDNVVVVAGGYGAGNKTEYLDLTTLTWSDGPEVLELVGGAVMTGSIMVGRDKIFQLEEVAQSSGRQWQWVEARKLEAKNTFGAFIISSKFCD